MMAFLFGCVDPYTPVVQNQPASYLVIDGVIDTGGDTIVFKLSRTVSITGTDSTEAELNALISIEEQNGNSYQLINNGNGTYYLPPGLLDPSKNMRLNVLGGDLKTYLSDYLPVVVNPPIDTISIDTAVTINSVPGIELYANTKNPVTQASYYLWRYDETWAYNAKYETTLLQNPDGTLTTRTPDQLIYSCFITIGSTDVLISSTSGLSENVIKNFPLTHIPYSSPKTRLQYSMLLRQYAITKEAFEFWSSIKKNTEGLGTIFGPLPVQVTGNYTCVTDPSTPVIGFLSVTNQQKKRITFDDSRIPYAPIYDPFYAACEMVLESPELAAYATTQLFLYPQYQGTTLEGYYVTSPQCGDCRKHYEDVYGNTEATLTRPSFFK
jgi:Domain of unknown function (DUF4249)